ncbi:MAG TPA: glutathione synthase, partial [Pseudomonadales bacterium]|nr:glutathione synthase [Pseudomonadales bacterium]
MTIRLGVVMDPIGSINIKKDSTFAMLLAAQKRGFELFYMEQGDLFVQDGRAFARMRMVSVQDDPISWFSFHEESVQPLANLSVVLMRKDPPFDMNFIYTTYILERAESEGLLVVNKPQALRDHNEKFAATEFPQCTPPTLVSSNSTLIKEFVRTHQDAVIKPLDGMGGASIFRTHADDLNLSVIIETVTQHGRTPAMVQRYIPEITDGDKRILLVDGKPVPYCLARIPAAGEARGNLA